MVFILDRSFASGIQFTNSSRLEYHYCKKKNVKIGKF